MTTHFQPQAKEKLNAFTKTNFHVVADFDKTLTKAFVDGLKVQSVYMHLRNGKYLTPEYAEKAHALFDQYYPYEISTDITEEERYQKMQEWWESHYQLMRESGMHKGVIQDLARSNDLKLRGGATEFFETLAKHNIPLLIFSAGIGNVIEEFLKHNNLLTPNVHIISNFYKFNEMGVVTGVKDKFITVVNKHEYAIQESPYLQEIQNKPNVILLGDSLADVGMAAGIAHDTILKIGFLNRDVEKLLPVYKEKFDIVIADSSEMNEVNFILKKIT